MKKEKGCSTRRGIEAMLAQGKEPFFREPDRTCSGSLWICRGYYFNGSSDYKCEKHAVIGMKLNPVGPVYRPMRERRKK